ncbi:MAG TPA: ankyrin repeat domain-containing protein [Stellaceae bacterium]|nr:ankyrin repeat domain-containing protein [Stellaceae bacterium]
MKPGIGRRALLASLGLALAAGPARAQTPQKLFDWYSLANAAAENKTDDVAIFLRKGENPNFLDPSGRSPLDYAASFGNTAMIKLLLNAGARVDYRDKDGATALHWAAEAGQAEAIAALVQANAPVDAINRQGITPLMLAAGANKGEAVKALLKAGADPKRQDFTGRDARSFAAGHANALRALEAATPG